MPSIVRVFLPTSSVIHWAGKLQGIPAIAAQLSINITWIDFLNWTLQEYNSVGVVVTDKINVSEFLGNISANVLNNI